MNSEEIRDGEKQVWKKVKSMYSLLSADTHMQFSCFEWGRKIDRNVILQPKKTAKEEKLVFADASFEFYLGSAWTRNSIYWN